MDNLTKHQITRHYLNVYLNDLKSRPQHKSTFGYAFFTQEELDAISTHFKYSEGTVLSDADILAFVLSSWKQEQEVSENPNEDYLKDMIHQLGLRGHYLQTKAITDWDEYDYANFNTIQIKSGKARYAYGIYHHDIDAEDIDAIKAPPFRWFESIEKAKQKRKEYLATGLYSAGELHIHKDLRAI